MLTLAVVLLIESLLITFRGVASAEDIIFSYNDTVIAKADEKVILSCSYTGTVYDLFWYRQFPGSALQFLIMESSGFITHAAPQVPGITMANRKDSRHMELDISSASVSYSALYYCAVQPTVKGNILTPYKNQSDLNSKDTYRTDLHTLFLLKILLILTPCFFVITS
ncbi:hypothetical protein R3I93_007376 [Phoxinus phoxinus]|uniref:Immunoglobulin V-set domain-containing protein n=1 Tax=Phoxinus phoxinus TaxID=58324 RepID=A0AAN9D960_9TELE